MIKLKSLLHESLQNLYHATDLWKLTDIIKTDSIKFTFAGGTESDMKLNGGKMFFLSAMRSKYGNYARSMSMNTVINLNGHAISSNFKIMSVDYWQTGPEKSEEEDRIVSDKSKLSPLKKYVDEIHVYLGKTDRGVIIRGLFEIEPIIKQLGIPIYFYEKGQESAFRAQQKSKATTDFRKVFPISPEKTKDELDQEEFSKNYKLKYRNNKDYRTPTYLEALIAIYKGEKYEDQYNSQEKMYKWLRYYPHDAITQSLSDAHNAKGLHPEIFDELTKIIRKEKRKDLKDFVQMMIDRVKDDKEEPGFLKEENV